MSEFNMNGKDWDNIINYAKVAWEEDKSEIGGMMIASKDTDGDFVLTDPVILKQQVSGSNTILEKEALAKYYATTAIKNDGKEIIFVWWHSHHTMAAFWSSTDLAEIETTKSGNVSMSLVVNLKEEYIFRVNIWQPIEAYKELIINIIRPAKLVPKSILKEYKKLCSDIPSVITTKVNPYYTRQKYKVINNHIKWADTTDNDSEYVDLETKVDNLLTDLTIGSINYDKFKSTLIDLNMELEKTDSELECEIPSENLLKSLMTDPYWGNDACYIIKSKKPSNQLSMFTTYGNSL